MSAEEKDCGNPGEAYCQGFKKAIDKSLLILNILGEEEDITEEAKAYAKRGIEYFVIEDFHKAIEYHKLYLKIAEEMGSLNQEGIAFGNLASSYYKLGDFKTAVYYSEQQLKIATKLGNSTLKKHAYARLGRVYYEIANFSKALEYHKLYLKIVMETGDKAGEGIAYNELGNAYHSLGDFRKAIDHHELYLNVTKELCSRAEEEMAYRNLGNDYHLLGDFRKAVHYHELNLNTVKEIGDRAREGRAHKNLGNDYSRLGDFKKAIDHHELYLQIAKELGDRREEQLAYFNLGNAYLTFGNSSKAIECYEFQLKIAKEMCDRAEEGLAYSSIGNAYQCIGEFHKAIKYQENCLQILTELEIELRDKALLCSVYCGLGNAYGALGFFKQAIDYFERCLEIAIKNGDKEGEASACSGLGDTYDDLGNFKKSIEYHKRELKLSKELRDQKREGRANSNLGRAYHSLGDFEKAIHHQERQLKIAKKVQDMAGEGRAFLFLGTSYRDLGDFQKAIEYYEQSLEIATKREDRLGIGSAYGNLGFVYLCLRDPKKAEDYHKRHLKISQEVGDRIGEAKTYFGLGRSFELSGSLQNSRDCYQCSVKILNDIRATGKVKDELKISLRHVYKNVYTRLWILLLKQGMIAEALFAVDQGRAQALKDLMELNYGMETTFASVYAGTVKENIPDTLSSIRPNMVFTAVHGKELIFWVTEKGTKLRLRRNKITETNSVNEMDAYLHSLIETVCKNIGVKTDVNCEDRSLEKLRNNNVTVTDQTHQHSPDRKKNTLKTLYEVVVSPILDLVSGEELIIVPDGPLWLAPYNAFMDSSSKYLCETLRIRVVPSLACLKLIADCPADYHRKSGALLVGDPWVQEVVFRGGGKLHQLPCARKEVEMIGEILNTAPLTGTVATKEEVLKRLSSVALVHIAAHGSMKTGEIALAPNPTTSSRIPTERDFLLTMTDVLNVKLRAKLVVLSCCHSGRGEIKAEGVVGIARAFLGAGARSVLVSLWAIDDEATLEFMKRFYEHLAEGRSASDALNRAMNYMRQSDQFSEVRFWAPFVLIGDDVTLDFGRRIERNGLKCK